MNFLIPVLPMIIGFIIDLILGDPYTLPHPIRLIGTLISRLEKFIRKHFKDLRAGGVFLAVTVLVLSTVIPFLMLFVFYKLSMIVGIAAESIFGYYMIAPKCLSDESMKVYRAINENDTEKARKAVSMIVGRDTASLDESGIIRAAVETV
ncbi:MAG: cobalamin biosynthesis protein, partial [Oscillospiraceae bacterium]|nr:cobalamin biosynthesis protein [Oscillospiraceae bacterium]